MLEMLMVIAALCTVNSGGMESSIRKKTFKMQLKCQQDFQKCIEKKSLTVINSAHMWECNLERTYE